MHRFFLDPEAIQATVVTFPQETVFQIGRVLRMRPGDRVIVLDNSGWEREVELTEIGRRHALGTVCARRRAKGEARTKISLYQAVLKGKKLEPVFQKCTELGVVEFVPTLSARCVVDSLEDLNQAKFERWRAIIREAAEQSHRGRLPELLPATLFGHALDQIRRFGGFTIIPWEGETRRSLREVLRGTGALGRPFGINLFIGPEGGFTEEEIERAQAQGAIPVTLGPRILRAETAGIAATAAILYELGDWE
ncbi:MAG: 16S rRNA (uracil(1498)-N(3))-methyltransferase [Ardenticatenaceae bacterium]|nr:16S rRNA (uracil(1498)-N(3))-methyltransferase [Ardenticatenaceae bacterium]HBY93552.1 16S rRNA (uracil(1498)-N(3))-methyltransferase [Chloroflexota bacterium]